jgi:hypothetical protein
MLLEKGLIDDLLPCAGITLIRFYGFDLSPALLLQDGAPRETLKTFKALSMKA